MSFCVLALGCSNVQSVNDCLQYFTQNNYSPKQIIKNKFACAYDSSIAITLNSYFVYLSSMNNMHTLLDLSCTTYKNRLLYFKKCDSQMLEILYNDLFHWEIDQKLEVYNEIKCDWYMATILNIQHTQNDNSFTIKVHYNELSTKYDETIFIHSNEVISSKFRKPHTISDIPDIIMRTFNKYEANITDDTKYIKQGIEEYLYEIDDIGINKLVHELQKELQDQKKYYCWNFYRLSRKMYEDWRERTQTMLTTFKTANISNISVIKPILKKYNETKNNTITNTAENGTDSVENDEELQLEKIKAKMRIEMENMIMQNEKITFDGQSVNTNTDSWKKENTYIKRDSSRLFDISEYENISKSCIRYQDMENLAMINYSPNIEHSVKIDLLNTVELLQNESFDYRYPTVSDTSEDEAECYDYVRIYQYHIDKFNRYKIRINDLIDPLLNSNKYWIPSVFNVDKSYKVSIKSDIHNLSRFKYSKLYSAISIIFFKMLPMFEWLLQRKLKFPNYWLKNKDLQVIVGMQDYQLYPNQTYYGPLHREGYYEEGIEAVGIYYFDKSECIEDDIFQIETETRGICGGLVSKYEKDVIIQNDTFLVFNNDQINHKLKILKNGSHTKHATRKILTFFMPKFNLTPTIDDNKQIYEYIVVNWIKSFHFPFFEYGLLDVIVGYCIDLMKQMRKRNQLRMDRKKPDPAYYQSGIGLIN